MGEFDAPLDARIEQLLDIGTQGLNDLFGMCEGYPSAPVDRDQCRQYLRRQTVRNSAYYVNIVGVEAGQVQQESRLRDAIEKWLDEPGDLRSRPPEAVARELATRAASIPELAWALHPAPPPALGWRLGELAHAIGVALLGLILLPLIILALPFWLIALRIHENSDPETDVRPSPTHEQALANLEDHGPVNQFTAAGFIKPGWFRAITARIVLFLIDYGVRHIFNHANLAGVKTIHFARWVFIDGGRRVIFASNYDGSLESYMDDFIDKVAWGLNAVFSNGYGYPRTRWLLWGGARNEQAFKNYLRVHQVPTEVWFAPYGELTALNVANNVTIRTGLGENHSAVTAANWLQRL